MCRFHILYNIVLAAMLLSMSCSSASGNSESSNAPKAMSEEKSDVVFDADSAFSYIVTQVGFGPRVPGSTAHAACADWLAAWLREKGAVVDDKTERIKHPVDGSGLEVRNIFARFNPDAAERILILAHYDTRPWADADSDAANHNKPIDGANDGGSGVAVAMELARHASNLPKNRGLDVLFVDQEDSGYSGNDDSWCIGSAYWAMNQPYSAGNLPRFAVLLDMVGGRNARFPREYFSEAHASQINDIVWSTARRLGYTERFPDVIGGAINDDHIPLLRAGIPTIDIIETTAYGFNPTWHTLDDNLDNIDKTTLKEVGDVMLHIIYKSK